MKSLKTGQYKRAWPLQEHLVKTLLFSFYLKKKKIKEYCETRREKK